MAREAPPATEVLAFDVGGANIKAADGRGGVHCESFALWRRRDELASRLADLAWAWRPRRIVATMTGEIADCYRDRREGVAHIVAALEHAAAATGADLSVYLVDGRLASPREARDRPLAAAASNWHALSRLAAAAADRDRALLVDVGSTTTDILVLDRHGPRPLATDDPGRLESGELVYTGIERTPLPAIVRSLPMAGRPRPIAAETFARSQDAWLLVGGIAEDPACVETADGRPATREAARDRLARSFLLDPERLSHGEARAAAEHCVQVQARLVARALRRVIAGHGTLPERVVLSGHGTALAVAALDRAGFSQPVIRLDDVIGPAASRAAPAHALALVASGAIR